MAVHQAYQADLLRDLDEGQGMGPNAIKELRQATDLSLCATRDSPRYRPLNGSHGGNGEALLVEHLRHQGEG